MTGYSDQFYRDIENTALPSARRIVPILVDLIAPTSVVDLGCGDGSWLSVFREHGASRILGFDGEWVDERRLRIPLTDFRRAKLDEPAAADRRFDLAVVHPDRFHDAVRLARPRFGRWLKMAPDVVRRSLGRSGRSR